jgi:hypothetical protein
MKFFMEETAQNVIGSLEKKLKILLGNEKTRNIITQKITPSWKTIVLLIDLLQELPAE